MDSWQGGTRQFPKLEKDTMNGINASDFASSAAVKQQPAYLAVGCAWIRSESSAWRGTPCFVVSVRG